MRMCPGVASEYEMCNNHPDNCTVVMDEIDTGVSLTFPLIPIERVSSRRHRHDHHSVLALVIVSSLQCDICTFICSFACFLIQWEDVEEPIFVALAAVINDHYCKESNDTYRAVCGGDPPTYVPYSTHEVLTLI